jgi:RNA polymerase sigma-70 factor (ECF subfamily)
MMSAGAMKAPAVSRVSGAGSSGWTETAAINRSVSDDRLLVDAVLAGDREAFRALVDREGPAVIAACARVLADHGEAEDVAQDAFVIAYRAIGTWRGDGALGAWVSRIAVRLALRRARQRRQVTWLDPLAADADLPGRDRYRSQSPSEASDPAHSVLRSERDSGLRAAVAALDEPYREVVALRFFAERSLAEIAEATDRPLGTVKTHLHRGLARLRRALDEAES